MVITMFLSSFPTKMHDDFLIPAFDTCCEEELAVNQILTSGKEIGQREDMKRMGECHFWGSCSFKIEKRCEGQRRTQRESGARDGSEEERLESDARTGESLQPVLSREEGLTGHH